ncbi:MAG: hypothetical protein WD048_16275 [Chitinophagales bacterium]
MKTKILILLISIANSAILYAQIQNFTGDQAIQGQLSVGSISFDSTQLNVSSTNQDIIRLERNQSGSDNNTFKFKIGSVAYSGQSTVPGSINFILGNTNPGDMVFSTDEDTVQMVLKNGGNIGIGTTSPEAMLHVNGGAKISGDLELSGQLKIDTLVSASDTFIAVEDLNVLNLLKVGTSSLYLGNPPGSSTSNHIYSTNGAMLIQDGDFSNEDVIIADNNGNVGIGIDLPQAKLHVDGEASINEKVGIGTYSQPIEKKLHVRTSRSGGGGGQQLLSSGSDENGIRLEDRIATGIGDIISAWDLEPIASETSGENSFRIGMPNTPVITILENKNVGIGTTEPEFPLHIELPDDGNLNAVRFEGKRSTNGGHAVRLEFAAPNSPAPVDESDFHIVNANTYSSSEGNKLIIRSTDDGGVTVKELISFNHSGETGIGNVTPQAKLHVSGGGVFEGNYGHILLKSTGANSSWSIQSHAANGGLHFRHDNGGYDFWGDIKMRLSTDGTLKVGGGIEACEVEVQLDGWCDYVFDDSYNLMALEDLVGFIKSNKHLPGIPSENELMEQGSLKVGKMQKLQMVKIEELTLYILEQNKKIEQLMAKNEEMMGEINELKSKVK